MNWTKDIPQRSGYYWCKQEPDISIVYANLNLGLREITVIGDNLSYELDDFKKAEWSGPIKPPG